MTKTELNHAQGLLTIFDTADRIAEQLDPQRKRKGCVIEKLDLILTLSREAFFAYCGKFPFEVSMTELNNMSPTPWAKSHKPPNE